MRHSGLICNQARMIQMQHIRINWAVIIWQIVLYKAQKQRQIIYSPSFASSLLVSNVKLQQCTINWRNFDCPKVLFWLFCFDMTDGILTCIDSRYILECVCLAMLIFNNMSDVCDCIVIQTTLVLMPFTKYSRRIALCSSHHCKLCARLIAILKLRAG